MAKREPKGAMELAYQKSLQVEEQLFGTQTKIEEEKEMTKEVKVINGSDVAVVRLGENGKVEIVRDGNTVPQTISLEAVVDKFQTYGWSVVPQAQPEPQPEPQIDKAEATAAMNNVPVQTQKEVDEYLALHAQKAELEAKMEKLKKTVRGYMENNNIDSIAGTNGKQIYLQAANASNSTATFSNYEIAPVMAVLNNNELLRQVTEVRVNSEKLEALLKLDKLPKEKVTEIKSLKITNPGTPRFSVKK